jgi:hypothetical protein
MKKLIALAILGALAASFGCTTENSSEGIPDDLPPARTTADPNQAPTNDNAANAAPEDPM